MQQTNQNEKETVRAVDRALDILMAFTKEKPKLNLVEISEKVSLPKTTVFRIIQSLQNKGFVYFEEESGKYQLGLTILGLTNVVLKSTDLRQKAYPVMRRLRDECGETINLFILRNLKRVCIESVTGPNLLQMQASIGDQLPLYLGASGKVILAYQPEAVIQKVCEETGLRPYTINSIRNCRELFTELERIRSQGYALSNGEREIGICSISAPIWNYKGEVEGAVSISGPETRMTHSRHGQLIKLVTEAAKEISAAIGGVI